jgi:hypothetical protein
MRAVLRLCVLLATAGVTVLGAAVGAPSAWAAEPGPIVNLGSGKCLQPFPDSYPGHMVDIYTNGIPVQQVSCDGSPEQQWRKEFVLNARPHGVVTPVYRVVNELTNKCLDVADANPANGAKIQQWDCNGGTSEWWYPYESYNGQYSKFENYRTARCLDVPGATHERINMQQWGR